MSIWGKGTWGKREVSGAYTITNLGAGAEMPSGDAMKKMRCCDCVGFRHDDGTRDMR